MRRTLSAFVISAVTLALPAAANADRALVLTPGNQMVSIDTGNPGKILSTIGITGIAPGETLRGIDFRPATGQLYGMSVIAPGPGPIHTYTIDPASGAATLVGQTTASSWSDVPGGFSFDAGIDRIRFIDSEDRNGRIRPADGSTTVGDSPISPGALSDLIAVAYDRSFAGATLTTAFVIDRTESRLAMLGGVDGFPPPTQGLVTPIGPLGFTLKAVDGGFDISADGRAFAALTDAADSVTRLYIVNLTTGGAGAIGPIGAGNLEAFSLALVPGTEALPDKKPPAGLIDIPPTLKLSKLRGSKVKFKFSSSEACTASAKLVVKKTNVAAGSATMSAAGVARIKLTTTKAGKKLLAGKHRAGAKLTLTLTDTAGNVGSVARKLSLR